MRSFQSLASRAYGGWRETDAASEPRPAVRTASTKQDESLMSRNANEQATSSQRFLDFFSLARDFLDRAAEYDAHGHLPDAITHYKKGLEVIQDALRLGVPPTAENGEKRGKLLNWQGLSLIHI
eukprot:5583122-Pyramimonas_sp.AAC.1